MIKDPVVMLTAVRKCVGEQFGCEDCPLLYDSDCRGKLADWLDEYIDQIKRAEDDLK